ncbi:hypothetical protein PMAYCL1PPCAC_28813 [Pristionchus mayeri]|uniref:Uncharacterized protein n=1 Tax=Pristionchus mayeri TaxID=1317129 RepID=A0AAN5IAC5_9BILA|nr:hypothetical protein PMAYCL1PPCAC_28813 [Pristionchus mayeri]
MSTSAREAAKQIAVLPSTPYCSSPSTSTAVDSEERIALNKDYLDEILRAMVSNCAIEDTRRMKNLHPIAANAYGHALKKHSHLRVAFHEPQRCKIVGGKKVDLSPPLPNIFVQGTRCSSDSAALSMVDSLLSSMSVVSRLSLVIEDTDQPIFTSIIEKIIAAPNVRLEVLQCKRTEGGKTIPQLIDLIKANASTLRILGRVGVAEAARSFSNEIHLERLSIMTFDLSFSAVDYDIKDELAMVQSSGAKFDHLSYTSFAGFDPTDDRMQEFLKLCGVKSLRLTMMTGPQIAIRPEGYPAGKVRGITHLEVGEAVEKPAHYNRLVVHEKTYKEVFPNVGHITFFQKW